ncbi:MAG: response regulator transcription factor [Vicinamibacteria bacterium]
MTAALRHDTVMPAAYLRCSVKSTRLPEIDLSVAPIHAPGVEARGRIVVIEDDQDIGEAVTYHLARAGYKVILTRTANEGFAAVCRGADLVVLDLGLPDGDGVDVCRQLRARTGSRWTPILMASARGEESDVAEGLRAGANDYLVKPYSMSDLVLRCRINLRRFLPQP